MKQLLRLLPGFLRRKVELSRMLTLLSRELVFSRKFDTSAKRRRVTKKYIRSCAAALSQPWPDLLTAVYKASRLPAAADEAYRLKLLLDSVEVGVDVFGSDTASSTRALVGDVLVGDALLPEEAFAGKTVLTVIIRVDESFLKSKQLLASLRSLQAQHCALWELWLVVADEGLLHEQGIVHEQSAKAIEHDQRIHHAVDASQACQQASGVLFHELHIGDCLHPALVGGLAQNLAKRNVHNSVGADSFDVIYTDHDHLDQNDERCRPVFKPDWNPDLFTQHDYIGPAMFFCTGFLRCRVSEVQGAGDLWAAFDDFNAESITAGKVIHIPKVLYHCRSNGMQSAGDSARLSAGQSPDGRCCYPLPKSLPEVTLIIPTRDRLDILRPCIDSILQKTAYPNYKIIIVDNQSKEPATLNWLEQVGQDARITVLPYDQLFNYSGMNNFAVEQSAGEIVGLINNDVEVINPGWLDEMAMHAWRPEIGCVGAKLYYGDGQIQHAGVVLGAGGGTAHSHRYFAGNATGYCGRLQLVQNVSAVTGACLLVRRELFERVGGLEAEHLPIAWNDIDLCLKVQVAGYRNLWTPYAELYHHESVSRGRDVSPEQRKRYQLEKAWMQQRWGEDLWCDPYYNPNLTAAREDFSLNMLHGLSERSG